MIDRVKLLMSVQNLLPAQLATTIGVQRSGISHILSGRNKPSLDFVLKVLESFPKLSEKWLLKGEGEMFVGDQSPKDLFQTEQKKPEDNSTKNSGFDEKQMLRDEEAAVYERKIVHPSSDDSKNIVEMGGLQDEKVAGSREQDHFAKDDEVKMQDRNILPKAMNAISKDTQKKITQLIIFYDDDSFKVYHPE
jgi:plasmid maintenance system antidote protein VapI